MLMSALAVTSGQMLTGLSPLADAQAGVGEAAATVGDGCEAGQ